MARTTPLVDRALMRISHFNRARKCSRGVSLIELLVVMAIVGALVGIGGPSVSALIKSANYTAKRNEFERAAALLPLRAYLSIQTFTLGGGDDAPNQPAFAATLIKDGWQLKGDRILYRENGVCIGGELTLTSPTGRKQPYLIEAPDCQPKRL